MILNRPATDRTSRRTASRAASVLLVAIGVLGVGCADDPPAGPDPAADPPGYTDPAALLAAHEKALNQQDYALYEKLLTDDFEYFPQAEDLIDFPWLSGQTSWGQSDELQMMAHMFTDGFQPADPQAAGTVESINAQFTMTGQHTDSDGSILVDTGAVMTVIYVTGSGARADIRFEFRFVTASDGFLRIRSIRERPPYGRATESETWGRIKSMYR